MFIDLPKPLLLIEIVRLRLVCAVLKCEARRGVEMMSGKATLRKSGIFGSDGYSWVVEFQGQ